MKLIKPLLIIFYSLSFTNIVLAKVNLPEYYISNNVNYLNSLVKENDNFNDENLLSLKIIGISFHQLAVVNVKNASESAVENLSKYIKLNQKDNEALAFLGSSYTMLARDSSAIYKKISYVNKGLELLDEAVKNAPSNFVIRLIRANVAFKLPDMFERKSTAYEDYNYLATNFKDESDFITEIYYKLGIILKDAKRFNEAEYYFLLASRINQSSDWAKKAREELND